MEFKNLINNSSLSSSKKTMDSCLAGFKNRRAFDHDASCDSQEFFCPPEPVSKPIRVKRRIPDYSSLSPYDFTLLRRSRGYSSSYTRFSSSSESSTSTSPDRSHKDSEDSDDFCKHDVLLASSQFESEFWTAPFLRKSRVSYAEEAVAADEGSFTSEDESPLIKIKQKILSSLSSLSLENYKEKHWYCYSCRRPRDRCKCLCSIS